MVFLPVDTEQLQKRQLNSFNPHRCKRAIWFLDARHPKPICQEVCTRILISIKVILISINVILISINVIKQVVHVQHTLQLCTLDFCCCSTLFDVEQQTIKSTLGVLIYITHWLMSIIS